MNLLCPNCQKPISVLEQYAGQPMQCPLCNGTFTVPALPATASETYALKHEPAPPAPATEPGAHPEAASQPPAVATAPPAPGEYAHGFTWRVHPRVVPWLAPVGLVLVFVMTLFPWRPVFAVGISNENAWEWGFGSVQPSTWIAIYVILTLLAMLVAVAVLLMNLKIIPDVPALHAVWPWRGLIVAGVSGLAFLFFFIECLRFVFGYWYAPILTMWGALAFWIHLIAVIGALLEFWLERRGPNRPVPRLDVHW
jgi:hypothetical protein